MPLFEFVDDQPQPYSTRYHRSEDFVGVKAIFWIRPMPSREMQRYINRRDGDPAHRKMPVDKVAGLVSDIDAEQLRAVLTKAENIYKDGDVIEDPSELGALVDRLDWNTVQELIGAAQNRAILASGAKNS